MPAVKVRVLSQITEPRGSETCSRLACSAKAGSQAVWDTLGEGKVMASVLSCPKVTQT